MIDTSILSTLPGKKVTIEVDGHPVSIKVDTGAEIMTLSEAIWNSLNIPVKLRDITVHLVFLYVKQIFKSN